MFTFLQIFDWVVNELRSGIAICLVFADPKFYVFGGNQSKK